MSRYSLHRIVGNASRLALSQQLRGVTAVLIVCGGLFSAAPSGAQQIDISGPPGSGAFGTAVATLPNGNVVVTDPNGPVSNVGTVYLYSPAGNLISSFSGSATNDHVGSGGITVLPDGNFVVASPLWNNGSAAGAGAVTWVSGSTGMSGVVSASNSLVGSTTNDRVGGGGVTVLSNGNYVVASSSWSNGSAGAAGAVTWVNGTMGLTGPVTTGNSLVGTTAADQVGIGHVTALPNGNYVVASYDWTNGTASKVGAVTWANGTTGLSGAVSASNSLVGTSANDQIGFDSFVFSGLTLYIPAVTVLSNGNYVVASYNWSNGAAASAGAVTWANGSSGRSGPVSAVNSLVGKTSNDRVGYPVSTTLGGVVALSNGNYVVASHYWTNGTVASAGAATWANGSSGASGLVSTSNSLVGTTAGDNVAGGGVTALTNGNYVVASPSWNGTVAGSGAVTWGNGSTGLSGAVAAANSLVGSTAYDGVGTSVTALSNGNYVVASINWNNGAATKAGAATWRNGSSGTSGQVSMANSLVGSTSGDQIGNFGLTALTDGNYVVASGYWTNAGLANAGAATWGNGTTGISGAVSSANSLVGAVSGDYIGGGSVTALSNGNYVVSSNLWHLGATAQVGAVTFGEGRTGISGLVSAGNSIVGNAGGDQVGIDKAIALPNGNYVVDSYDWINGSTANAGAVTLGRGSGAVAGSIAPTNSVLGTTTNSGNTTVFAYDPSNDQLVVGRPASNVVSLFKADRLFKGSFE